jgi:hypothetical protein
VTRRSRCARTPRPEPRRQPKDAWTLGQAVHACAGDVVAALDRWQTGQLRLGRQVLNRARSAGDRSQFENTWRVGDPLPLGLYQVGDSSLP